ncbi:MAG: M20 family metallopeptidase [Erysipelotrichaceae bacterium]|nr:M20 family metallopeptidase [Erysipelotrichaceae bacterium]
MEKTIIYYIQDHKEEIMRDLLKFVQQEASTSDIEALGKVREVLMVIIQERTGITPQVIETPQGHDVVTFEYGEGEKVILVGHYDTVHPIGTLTTYEEEGKLFGPGVYDMKFGIISGIWCVKALQELNIPLNHKLVFVFNGDEEKGSSESKEIISNYAEGAKYAFILEPANERGYVKTGRKGIAKFKVECFGKATHAGNNHAEGINAMEELANELIAFQKLTDYAKGTTVNCGVMRGGSVSNVVPAYASMEIDTRFKSFEERQRLMDAIEHMPVSVEGASRKVTLVGGRPPMVESVESLKLFDLVYRCGKKLGMELRGALAGGGSDGNEISAMGIPVIDGMGAVGDHAHGKDEYIDIDESLERIALLTYVMTQL